jgi:hypothetical protein
MGAFVPIFFCPVGKACLALFCKAGVIVTRRRLFGSGRPARAALHKYAMKPKGVWVARPLNGQYNPAAQRWHDWAGHWWWGHGRVF